MLLRVLALLLVHLCSVHNLVRGSKTRHPPCCRDVLSQVTCQRLQRVNGTLFAHRCNSEVDFRLIMCCYTCNRFKGLRRLRPDCGVVGGRELLRSLRRGVLPSVRLLFGCFFLLSSNGCFRFVDAKDIWSMKMRPCDGNNAFVAFPDVPQVERLLRFLAGGCEDGLFMVKYTLQNALEACRLPE
ncbi:hypothetical protein M3Y99_00073500 [Aphelenchoides fujianensis]|nr:hypothetical protein M3Y99_00073500 [Aphelenchoides fujianensis]